MARALETGQTLMIDGHSVSRVEAPMDAAETAALLAQCAEERLVAVPVGGASMLGLGNVPERVDLAISTRRLDRILGYEPTDMTLSVEAGATFASIKAILAERGQELPIDVPFPDQATIGGLIASGYAGSRRYGSGSLRDLLIGITTAHTSGIVAKAGGMVVKNVTGFDMMRLHLGSLGTLGVITSANFKVLPRPRAEQTLLASYESLDSALAAAERVRLSRVQPVAVDVFGSAPWRVAVRVMGRVETVTLLSSEATSLLSSDAVSLSELESAAWWQQVIDRNHLGSRENDALIRFGVRPRATAETVNALVSVAADIGLESVSWAVSPGLGTVDAIIGPDAAASPGLFRRFLESAGSKCDTHTVLSAPADWKRGLDIWGPEPDTIDVMRQLKQEFDQAGVLSPGRYAGNI